MTSEPIPPPSPDDTNAHNVLLVVDAESLLSRYPEPSLDAENPTSISDGFILFVVGDIPKEIVTNDSKIRLPGTMGRDIHFRGRTVSLIAEHSVVIYGMTVDTDTVLSAPHLEVHPDLTIPAPQPDAPSEPGNQKAHDHYWASTPKAPGKVEFELCLMLVNQRCEAAGYFKWVVEVEVAV
ncbi:AidA/PixA family protein [Pseudomonas botevensis]|uniref:AidA/PixA family protein n=1 Tax=Pseudomonas botevensis TaxID=2842352 RepID=UPI001C3C938A|nr:AidA/PixA family protein [Pseudomonas botevensis]MBV4475053.1 inclusion body family protein [Pseudomonas botevensis]